MAKQTILWTALPNGYSDDGRSLRVSLLVSPRLEPDFDPPDLRASSRTSWTGRRRWRRASSCCISAGPSRSSWVARTSRGRRASTTGSGCRIRTSGPRCFRRRPSCAAFNFATSRSIRSCRIRRPTWRVWCAGSTASSRLRHRINCRRASTFLDDPGWTALLECGRAQRRAIHRSANATQDRAPDRIRNTREQFRDFKRACFSASGSLASNLARFQLFHTPPSTPRRRSIQRFGEGAKSRAEWLELRANETAASPTTFKTDRLSSDRCGDEPIPDAVAAPRAGGRFAHSRATRFPARPMRCCGSKVELPPGSPTVTRLPMRRRARTRCSTRARFQPVPRPAPQPGDFRIANGLLDLDPKTFSFVQTDVDGAGHQAVELRAIAAHAARIRRTSNSIR